MANLSWQTEQVGPVIGVFPAMRNSQTGNAKAGLAQVPTALRFAKSPTVKLHIWLKVEDGAATLSLPAVPPPPLATLSHVEPSGVNCNVRVAFPSSPLGPRAAWVQIVKPTIPVVLREK